MAGKYVASLLEPGERVLYEAKINRKYVSCIAFVPFLLACALTAAFIFAFERVGAVLDNTRSPGLGLALLWLTCGGMMLICAIAVHLMILPHLFTIWGRRFSECVVTDQRVVCKLTQLMEYRPNTFVSLMPLSALRAVEIQQNRWERRFDCGTVTLLSDEADVRNQAGWLGLFGRAKMDEIPNDKATVPLKYVAAPFALKAFIEELRASPKEPPASLPKKK